MTEGETRKINVTVVNQDSTNSTTYTLDVYREPSTDAHISWFRPISPPEDYSPAAETYEPFPSEEWTRLKSLGHVVTGRRVVVRTRVSEIKLQPWAFWAANVTVNNTFTTDTDPKTGMLVPPQGWRQLTLSNPDTKSYGNNQFRRRSAGIHSFGAVRRRQFSIVSPAPLCTRRFNDTGRAEFPTGVSAYAYTCDRHRPTQELVYTLGEQQNAGQHGESGQKGCYLLQGPQ